MITPLPGVGRGDVHSGVRSLWRYAASFPIAIANPVSMGEGCTPLVEHPWRGGRAHFKLEWFAPTGSFKDRGASVMISALRQQGVTRLLEDSSGNGGAAIAAYAAAAGIKAKMEAMNDLARSGLYVEPTGAGAAAALSGLVRRGVIRPEEATVVVLTGAGLKATKRIGELMGVLPTSA